MISAPSEIVVVQLQPQRVSRHSNSQQLAASQNKQLDQP
jgi:hypothetical protein